MKSIVHVMLVLIVFLAPLAQADEEVPDLKVTQPLLQPEKSAAAKLTRMRSVRLWWNDDNRVVGVSLKGSEANDQAVALAGNLPGLRTLVLFALPENHLTDNGLAPLANVPALQLLSISGGRLTDAALTPLQGSSALRVLVLNGNFTDAALDTICSLPNLKQLDLSQSRITDTGISQLAQLTKIETLILNSTQITNVGLQQIAQLKTLKSLYLGNTSLDDTAVEQLQQMEQLELLFVRDTRISAEGVAKLQTALLPACQIIHQSGTFRGERNREVAMAEPAESNQWRAAH